MQKKIGVEVRESAFFSETHSRRLRGATSKKDKGEERKRLREKESN